MADVNETSIGFELPTGHGRLVYGKYETIGLAVVLFIIIAFSLMENLLTVYVFTTDPKLRTFSDRLVLNLAVADTLVSVTPMAAWIHLSVTTGESAWARASCVTFLVLEIWFVLTAILNTLMVSLDHYLTVQKEEWRKWQTPSMLRLMVIGPWVIIFSCYCLPVLLWYPVFGGFGSIPQGHCEIPFARIPAGALLYLLTPFNFIVAVPVVDGLIYYHIRRQFYKKIEATIAEDFESDNEELDGGQGPGKRVSMKRNELAHEFHRMSSTNWDQSKERKSVVGMRYDLRRLSDANKNMDLVTGLLLAKAEGNDNIEQFKEMGYSKFKPVSYPSDYDTDTDIGSDVENRKTTAPRGRLLSRTRRYTNSSSPSHSPGKAKGEGEAQGKNNNADGQQEPGSVGDAGSANSVHVPSNSDQGDRGQVLFVQTGHRHQTDNKTTLGLCELDAGCCSRTLSVIDSTSGLGLDYKLTGWGSQFDVNRSAHWDISEASLICEINMTPSSFFDAGRSASLTDVSLLDMTTPSIHPNATVNVCSLSDSDNTFHRSPASSRTSKAVSNIQATFTAKDVDELNLRSKDGYDAKFTTKDGDEVNRTYEDRGEENLSSGDKVAADEDRANFIADREMPDSHGHMQTHAGRTEDDQRLSYTNSNSNAFDVDSVSDEFHPKTLAADKAGRSMDTEASASTSTRLAVVSPRDSVNTCTSALSDDLLGSDVDLSTNPNNGKVFYLDSSSSLRRNTTWSPRATIVNRISYTKPKMSVVLTPGQMWPPKLVPSSSITAGVDGPGSCATQPDAARKSISFAKANEKRKKKMRSMSSLTDETSLGEDTIDALVTYSEDMQEARLTFVLGVVLVCCCVPFQVLRLVCILCQLFPGSRCLLTVPKMLMDLTQLVYLMRAAANPIVIFNTDRRYGDALKSRLQRWACFSETDD